MSTTTIDDAALTEAVPADVPNPLAGNPGALGLPAAIAGATGLVIVNAGWLDAGATGATLSILMACTSIGLLVAAIWAAALGQSVSASIFGGFAGFYASYTALVLGLGHNWFGVAPEGAADAVQTWLICWIVAFGVMTLVTLRLPFAFTFILSAVVVALVLLLLGSVYESTALTRSGAVAVFVFLSTAIYLYADTMSRETGGNGLPLGGPLVKS